TQGRSCLYATCFLFGIDISVFRSRFLALLWTYKHKKRSRALYVLHRYLKTIYLFFMQFWTLLMVHHKEACLYDVACVDDVLNTIASKLMECPQEDAKTFYRFGFIENSSMNTALQIAKLILLLHKKKQAGNVWINLDESKNVCILVYIVATDREAKICDVIIDAAVACLIPIQDVGAEG
ncbi:hypothetical protein ACJX0J_041269, partial [Zea mays]